MKNDKAAATPNTAAAAATPKGPTFKEAPRYRLLAKAFLSGVKVRRGNDWIPMDDVLLDPESQPLAQQLSGPFSGRGDAERVPLEIEYRGIPGEHMDPINEAAEWAVEHIAELHAHARAQRTTKAKGRKRDPIDALTIIGPGATVLDRASENV